MAASQPMSVSLMHLDLTVGASLLAIAASQPMSVFSDAPGSNCRSEPARDSGLIGGEHLADVHIHSCGYGCYWFRFYSESLGKAPSNQTLLPLSSGASPGLGIPSLRSCSVGPLRSAIHGRAQLTRHPCRVAHCAEPALGLPMEQEGQDQDQKQKQQLQRGDLRDDLRLEACAFPCGSRACSRWTLTMTPCHWKNTMPLRPLSGWLFIYGIRTRPAARNTARSKDRSLVSLDSSYRDNGERGTSKRQAGSLLQFDSGASGRYRSAMRPPSRASSAPTGECVSYESQVGCQAASLRLLICF